jgi:hypothetical protein
MGVPRQALVALAWALLGLGCHPRLRGPLETQPPPMVEAPRPIGAAVPPQASSVVLVAKGAGHLEKLIDFSEKLLGAESVQNFLDDSLLAGLAMELPSQEGPVGLFTLADFDGMVGLLGVTDGDRATQAAIHAIERRGGVVQVGGGGVAPVRLAAGRGATLVLDRGYLYFAVPFAQGELPAPQPGRTEQQSARTEPHSARTESPPEPTESVLSAVRQAPREGLEGAAVFSPIRARLPSGDLYLYRPTDGLFAAINVGERELVLEGLIHSGRPLWPAASKRTPMLLTSAPGGAIAAAAVSVPSAELAHWLAGDLGSFRRSATAQWARRVGLNFESLLGALSGELGALLYFDADAFLRELAKGDQKSEPRGLLTIEAELVHPEPILQLIEKQLHWPGSGGRYSTRLWGQPLELQLEPTRLRVSVGSDRSWRPEQNLALALQERFGGAFSSGHLSLMVDLGQLRHELSQPRTLEGIDPRRLAAMQAFAGNFLTRLTPVDFAYLDLSPDEAGAKLKGRLVLQSMEKPSR